MTAQDLLEPDALRAFAVFAQHRNFTTAATELHLSQPSLHVKITKLATALGLSLYERRGRGLVLTRAGRQLAAYAQDTRRGLKDFLAQLETGGSDITIAAGRGTLRWVIGDTIRQLTKGGTRVSIVAAERDRIADALATGTADVAVLAYDPPSRDLATREIAAYPQVLAVTTDHPLASRTRLRLADLAGLDLIVPPQHRPHRRSLERALLDAGVSWQPVAECDGWDLLVHFASLGIGATVVNGCVHLPPGMAAIPIRDLPKVRYWAAWRRQRQQKAQAFLTLRRADG